MMNTSNSNKNTSSKSPENKRPAVYVGMSGGVDSSVSAYLLKEQGYDVTGVFIKVWQPDTTDCGWKDERRDAMRVAAVLDIPFLTLDFSEKYKREVVDYMIEEYRAGRTPNPDIMCNRHVKFGSFLQYTLAEKVDYVATGHYAQNTFNQSTGFFEMKEGADANKDQSYFLWTLNQADLKHVLFPVGHLQKSEVRRIAEKAGLPVFDKKDSQGVCFIGHLDMKEFLKQHIKTEKGKILDIDGEVIGEHSGAILYTIGERHGMQLLNKTVASEPHFVIAKDIEKNTITVAPKSSFSNSFAKKSVKLINTSFSQDIEKYLDKKMHSRIRYRQDKQLCTLIKTPDTHTSANSEMVADSYIVEFDIPQKDTAEGQSVVLYDGNICLGGGIISFI